MAATSVRRAPEGAVFHTRIEVGRSWLALFVPLFLIAGLLLARSSAVGPPLTLAALTGAVDDASPAELTSAAATELETALSAGGAGISFEIVQRQTIVTRPGGPQVDVPDPVDPTRSLGLADSYEIGVLVSRGIATSAGFWSELRHGPRPDDPEPYDYDQALISRQALVLDGTSWRDDGYGWHETSQVPGIGLDPVSVGLLARLLRDATDARDATTEASDLAARPELADLALAASDPARTLEADTTVADAPGIIAVDLAAATELRGPARLAFDASGRLIGLTIVARNTNLQTFDLVIETVITLAYPADPPPLPEPLPAYVAPAPDPDEEAGS